MPSSSPHIICFAPYTDWSIHSARQVTILHALRLREATVSYVTCDGVFSDCDLFQQATGAAQGRQSNSCLICQASVAARLAAWNMPYRWLGTWLTPQDRSDVGRWISSLNPEDYIEAQFKDWEIGAWVRSSVRTELRCSTFDMSDSKTAATYASYLYSGALAALGLDRLFEDEKPDAQLLFNGRMAPTRIALELAKRRSIRTICEERAAVAGSLILFDNVNCLDVGHVDDLWDQWRGVPLTYDELTDILSVLENRRRGDSGEVGIFSPARQADGSLYDVLGLDRNKPLWVVFTSSEDEIADKADVQSIFSNQTAWIESTIKYASAHPEFQFVVRVHPNVGGPKSLGRNDGELDYFKELATTAPDNVRVVQPGDAMSSYALAEMCDLALVWYSTIGIETAALGRRVIRAGGYVLEHRDFIYAPDSPADYSTLLDSMRATPEEDELVDIARGALRFAHLWYLRRSIPFPLVDQPDWHRGEATWTDPRELAVGTDANLDRICEIFMSGRAVHDGPVARHADMEAEELQLVRAHVRQTSRDGTAAA